MDIKTPDIDFAAAMLTKGAKLSESRPWEKDGSRFCFCLVDVPSEGFYEYQTTAAKFSIQAFTSSRRFLLEVVKRN